MQVLFTQRFANWLPCLLLRPIADAYLLSSTVALLLLGTYKELLPRFGLRRLLLLNLSCSGLEVLYFSSVCMFPSLVCLRNTAAYGVF